MPKRKLKEHIKELNALLENYIACSEFICVTSKGTVFLDKSYQEKCLYVFYQLKLTYLKESYSFQIISSVFISSDLSIQKLSEQLFLSESYTRRQIKTLNSFLENFDFQIVETEDFYLDFKGNELFIRLFLFILFINSYQTLEWPFPEIYTTSYVSEISRNEDNHFLFFTAVNQRRMASASAHRMLAMDERFTPYMDVLMTIFPVSSISILNDLTISKDIEGGYIDFFLHVLFPQRIPTDVKKVIGQHFLNITDDSLSFFVKQLIDHLKCSSQFLMKNSEQENLMTYYLTIFTMYVELTQDKFHLFPELVFPYPEYQKRKYNQTAEKINLIFSDFLQKNVDNPVARRIQQQPLLQYYFGNVLYSQLESEAFPKLFIHVSVVRDFTANDAIKIRLLSLYNSETIVFCEDFSSADLIITDRLVSEEYLTKTFHFDEMLKPDLWKRLFTLIEQLIFEKIDGSASF